MCQVFKNEIFGVTILQGIEFSIFLLIFEWALQQCSATALPADNRILRTMMALYDESLGVSDVNPCP